MSDDMPREFASYTPSVSPYLTRPLRSRDEVMAERVAREREANVVRPFAPMVTSCGSVPTVTMTPQAAA